MSIITPVSALKKLFLQAIKKQASNGRKIRIYYICKITIYNMAK